MPRKPPKPPTTPYRILLAREDGPPLYLQTGRARCDIGAIGKARQAAKNEAARHGLTPDAKIIIERVDGTAAGEFSYAELMAHDPQRP
jgi:hypothetical protein